MKKITRFCVTFLLLLASSALSQDVDYTFDNSADFSKFKTYKWVPFKNVAPIDNLTDEQIRAAVDAAMSQKGLTKVDVDSADLFIDYQSSELITEDVPRVPGYGAPLPTTYNGDLTIDMYYPANHKLVWRGTASKTLNPKAFSLVHCRGTQPPGSAGGSLFRHGFHGKRIVVYRDGLYSGRIGGWTYPGSTQSTRRSHTDGSIRGRSRGSLPSDDRVWKQNGWRVHVLYLHDPAANQDYSALDCFGRLCLRDGTRAECWNLCMGFPRFSPVGISSEYGHTV